MKLTAQQIRDVTLVVSQIIREQRSMPQRGKFRLARLHAKLLPEFNVIDAQRDSLVKEHGDPVEGDISRWEVSAEHMPEFNAAWKTIADEEIEVDVQPIHLSDLDCGTANGGIEANELIVLGDLITE